MANKLKFKDLQTAIAGISVSGGGNASSASQIEKAQNIHILASDPAFLDTLVNDVFPTLLERVPQNNKILVPRYLDQFTSAVGSSDLALIKNSLSAMFNERVVFDPTKLADSSKGFPVVYNNSDPNKTDIIDLQGDFGPYDITFDIPANKVLGMSPQTRVILGFDSVNFYDENGLIADAAIFTTANKAEVKQLEESTKSTVSTYTAVDITTSISIGKIITNIKDIKTLSYSTHRDIAQARSCGSSFPTGLSRGGRTIAGSLICTVRLNDPMLGLDPQYLLGYDDLTVESDQDIFKEQMLPDQYPLFDLLVIYNNEYGDSSALTIFGMAISDTGQTSSISDTETEIQYTYVAMDINPLRKLMFNADGVVVNPFRTKEYMKRKKRIIEGNTIHNDPFVTPSIVTDFGNISHLDFLL